MTPQVSKLANTLVSPAPPARTDDVTSSSAPFDQVLSREVTDRSKQAEATRQAAKSSSKSETAKDPSDAKAATEGKQTAGSKVDEVDNTDDADKADNADKSTDVAQAPSDMLALVADLALLKTARAESAAAGPSNAAGSPATALTSVSVPGAAAKQAGKGKTDAALEALAGARQPADGASAGIAANRESGNTNGMVGIAVKDAQANGATAMAAAASAATSTTDFASAMKDSLSSVNAAAQQAQALQSAANQGVQQSVQQLAGAAERLAPPVGTSAWDQALGQKVVWMVAGEQQSASLTLNPPDLGPLKVVLNVSNAQATATFSAAQPEVRQALEAALPKLREMLGEAGIQLGQASVNSGAPNQQGDNAQHASSASHRLGQGDGHDGQDGNDGAQMRTGRIPTPAAGRGMVDTFV